MFKHTLLVTLLFFAGISNLLQAQTYGNEWIDYEKSYHKIRIANDGLYKIPFSALDAAGLSETEGKDFQLICKGEEVPIYVSTEGQLESTDFIEFVGYKNDGEFDTSLYSSPEDHTHPSRSLFTDSITYYLTVNTDSENLRFISQENNLTNAPEKEAYFWETLVKEFANVSNNGETKAVNGVHFSTPKFLAGEGFVSSVIPDVFLENTFEEVVLKTHNAYTELDAPASTLDWKLVGRTDYEIENEHQVTISIADEVIDENYFDGYEMASGLKEVPTNLVSTDLTRIKFETEIIDPENTSYFSIINTQLSYPKQFDLLIPGSSLDPADVNSSINFISLNANEAAYIEISNFNGGTAPVVYDLTNGTRYNVIEEAGLYKVNLVEGDDPSVQRKLLISNTTETVCIGSIFSSICVKSINTIGNAIQFTDFSALINQGDYILLTNPILREAFNGADQVMEYANYRSSELGGNYNTTIVEVTELYDQFAWGIPTHSLSIRNFINYAVQNWATAPEQLLLIGKGVKYSKARYIQAAYEANLLPTFGDASSDVALVAQNNDNYRPQLAVGRISAKEPKQVYDYLNKVKEYETPVACNTEDLEWRKNFLHIATNHQNEFLPDSLLPFPQNSGLLDIYKALIEGGNYQGEVIESFIGTHPEYEDFPIDGLIENGLAVFTHFGHSNSNGENFGFNFSDNPYHYDLNGKYPFLIGPTSYLGNQFNYSIQNTPLIEEYTLAEEAGSIVFLAPVVPLAEQYHHEFMQILHEQFTNTNIGQSFGECLKETIKEIYANGPTNITSSDYYARQTFASTMTYAGDPALVMGNLKGPEYAMNQSITIFADGSLISDSTEPTVLIDEGEELEIELQFSLNNLGINLNEETTISLVQTLEDGSVIALEQMEVLISGEENEEFSFLVSLNPTDHLGLNNFEIILNADQALTENCYENNSSSVELTVELGEIIGIGSPLPNKNHLVPNIIMPNGDGNNDAWILKFAENYPNLTFEIYSKIGQKIYSQSGYNHSNAWTGIASNGSPVSNGTYYYVIQLNDGTSLPLKGALTVIR